MAWGCNLELLYALMKTVWKILAVLVGLFLIANVEAAPVSTVAGAALLMWAFTGKTK